MYSIVKAARYLKDYRIEIEFQDGAKGEADLSAFADPDNVFRKFLDVGYFRDFRVEYGTLTWGSGELDIAPESLYSIATGKPVDFST